MASIYRRSPESSGGTFWIAFYHPRTGQLIRLPLDTNNRAHAERIRLHVACLCKSASPSAPVLSPRLQEALGVAPQSEAPAVEPDNGGRFFRVARLVPYRRNQCHRFIQDQPTRRTRYIGWLSIIPSRKSLETRNREEAERRARRIEAFCTVIATQPVEIPTAILEAIGAKDLPLMPGSFAPPPTSPAPRRCKVEEALGSLLKNLLVGNDDLYLATTPSHSRALFGSDMVDR